MCDLSAFRDTLLVCFRRTCCAWVWHFEYGVLAGISCHQFLLIGMDAVVDIDRVIL